MNDVSLWKHPDLLGCMKHQICFVGFSGKELESLQNAASGGTALLECSFCEDGETALVQLTAQPYQAIVANMRLKGMNGAELLREAASCCPRACRIVVGNLADQEFIVNCIGETHQFISAPWQASEIITIVERSLALDSWISNDALRAFVPRLGKLPGLPATYFEVLKRAESPNATVESIGEIIARDPALTARLLQMVNSVACGLEHKVTSPMEAVSILGLEAIKSLVLCLQVFDRTMSRELPGLSMNALWRESFMVANYAAKIALAQSQNSHLSGDAYTAGLLHRIGQIVVAANLGTEYGTLLEAAREKKASVALEEKQRWGVTSDQVGAYLLGVWGLPLPLVEAVALYQNPRAASTREFSVLTAVHVAAVMACEESQRADGEPALKLDLEYLVALRLSTRLSAWRKKLAHEGVVKERPPARIERPAAPVEKAIATNSGSIGKWMLVTAIIMAAVFVYVRRPDFHLQSVSASATNEVPDATNAAPAPPPQGLDALKVQGIIYHGSNSLVMIDGQALPLGGHVAGAEIVLIEPTRVTLELDGRQRIYNLK